MNAYRFERLAAAEQHAAATGYQGARFPWESALDGTEQIPPPVSVNSEGLYEQHITADIALAQWQYYLATGDKKWLAQPRLAGDLRGGDVLGLPGDARQRRQLPHRRRHRARRGEPGRQRRGLHQRRRAGDTLRDAVAGRAGARQSAPPRTGRRSRPAWSCSMRRAPSIHPEFTGYGGQLVKQADVTLLQYPWAFPMSPLVAQNDLDYYVPRSDPDGPSMSDAISSIDTAALGTPGCCQLRVHASAAGAVHPRRVRPVLRDPHRRRVHVHDRHRRLPAGVPVRLLRDAVERDRPSSSPRA